MTTATERPPWVTTPAEDEAIAAHRARLKAERAKPVEVGCEVHERSGACTPECADLENAMSGDYSEPRIYSDYLGGTSSIDVSGCHSPPPMPEFHIEHRDGRLYGVTEHPGNCQCGKPECPEVIAEDAHVAVMGDRSGESWTLTEEGWKRVR